MHLMKKQILNDNKKQVNFILPIDVLHFHSTYAVVTLTTGTPLNLSFERILRMLFCIRFITCRLSDQFVLWTVRFIVFSTIHWHADRK